MAIRLHNLEADAEGVFLLVPVGAEELEAAYLRGGADVLADAGTDIVIADTDETDGLGGVGREAVEGDIIGEIIAGDKLKRHRQVVGYELVHAALYLTLVLARGLLIDMEAHLALLSLYMGIERTTAVEHANHRLIEQMFSGVGWWELFFVVLVEYVIGHK